MFGKKKCETVNRVKGRLDGDGWGGGRRSSGSIDVGSPWENAVVESRLDLYEALTPRWPRGEVWWTILKIKQATTLLQQNAMGVDYMNIHNLHNYIPQIYIPYDYLLFIICCVPSLQVNALCFNIDQYFEKLHNRLFTVKDFTVILLQQIKAIKYKPFKNDILKQYDKFRSLNLSCKYIKKGACLMGFSCHWEFIFHFLTCAHMYISPEVIEAHGNTASQPITIQHAASW